MGKKGLPNERAQALLYTADSLPAPKSISGDSSYSSRPPLNEAEVDSQQDVAMKKLKEVVDKKNCNLAQQAIRHHHASKDEVVQQLNEAVLSEVTSKALRSDNQKLVKIAATYKLLLDTENDCCCVRRFVLLHLCSCCESRASDPYTTAPLISRFSEALQAFSTPLKGPAEAGFMRQGQGAPSNVDPASMGGAGDWKGNRRGVAPLYSRGGSGSGSGPGYTDASGMHRSF